MYIKWNTYWILIETASELLKFKNVYYFVYGYVLIYKFVSYSVCVCACVLILIVYLCTCINIMMIVTGYSLGMKTPIVLHFWSLCVKINVSDKKLIICLWFVTFIHQIKQGNILVEQLDLNITVVLLLFNTLVKIPGIMLVYIEIKMVFVSFSIWGLDSLYLCFLRRCATRFAHCVCPPLLLIKKKLVFFPLAYQGTQVGHIFGKRLNTFKVL